MQFNPNPAEQPDSLPEDEGMSPSQRLAIRRGNLKRDDSGAAREALNPREPDELFEPITAEDLTIYE